MDSGNRPLDFPGDTRPADSEKRSSVPKAVQRAQVVNVQPIAEEVWVNVTRPATNASGEAGSDDVPTHAPPPQSRAREKTKVEADDPSFITVEVEASGPPQANQKKPIEYIRPDGGRTDMLANSFSVIVETPTDQFVENPIPVYRSQPPPTARIRFSTLNAGNVETVSATEGSNFRASIFAGAVSENVANHHAAKRFERELDRKSYRQARADDFGQFDEQQPEEHEFQDTYAVSRGELLVAELWRCVRKIAFGSTSVVYLAFSIDYEQEAAVKVCSFSKWDEALSNEANVYYYIQGGPGIPQLYWYGQEHQRHFLVTELLGPNLMDMLHYCNGKFRVKTVCMIAVQILKSLDWLHRSGYIHRDIRPQNFCMGNGPTSRQVFLIDYATVIKHRPKITVQGQLYIPKVVGTRLRGHAIYDSVGAHYGNERSYRDDAESILYMLAHFLIGDLPWRGLKYNRKGGQASECKALLDQVCLKKLTSSFLEATPPEFEQAYNHIRSLPYDQIPDYELLIHLFLTMLKDDGATFDYHYDWLPAKESPALLAQKEQKRLIIKRLVPPKVRPFLALQTHRIQYIPDEHEDEDPTTAAAVKNVADSALGPDPIKTEEVAVKASKANTEDAVFTTFIQRDKKD